MPHIKIQDLLTKEGQNVYIFIISILEHCQ